MKEVPTVPMFPEPERLPLELSQMWGGRPFRATVGEVKWTPIKVKNPIDCTECLARQHETKGACGPRRAAKVRRRIVKAPGSTLDLCREHEMMWRRRDEADLADAVKR
jgi:hypothetical protein